jgi:hypothetical protein
LEHREGVVSMRRTLRSSFALLTFLAVALWTLPAGADHPGRYLPSPESTSKNMKLLGSAPKTNPASFYRNSDLAFWGRLAFAGNYEGFRVLDISAPGNPKVLADVNCPGQQHDVSVWRNLLFLSIDRPLTAPECGSPQTPVVNNQITPGFEGIRIFDVANPSNPRYVGAVATDCGSHTHTLCPTPTTRAACSSTWPRIRRRRWAPRRLAPSARARTRATPRSPLSRSPWPPQSAPTSSLSPPSS